MSRASNGTEDVLTTTKRWDKLSRLTSTSTSRPGEPDPDMLYAYSHNTLNQRTRATREDGQYWDYGYDDLGQVTVGQKKSPDGTQLPTHDFRYQYDTIGNRQSATANQQSEAYTSNSLNQYESILHHSSLILHPSHDGDGNQTANGRGWTYTYDGDVARQRGDGQSAGLARSVSGGRWIRVPFGRNPSKNRLKTAENGSVRIVNHYDSQSRRIKKEVFHWDSVTSSFLLHTSSLFLYDGWNLIAELTRPSTSSGQTNIEMFVWGLDLSGTLQGTHSTGSGPSAGGVGGLLAILKSPLPLGEGQGEGANAYFASADGNGNISALYDLATGAQVASYEYDPFGNVIVESGGGSVNNAWKFSTKYMDESGLYYYGYRYYAPDIGRWLGRDPIEEQGGGNLYAFVGNDGVNRWDLLGLAWPVDPYKIAILGFNPTGSTFDGSGYIDQGASDTFTSLSGGRVKQSIIDYFDINGDNRLDEKDCPPFDLRMTGYSWGAWTALEVAHDLSRSRQIDDPKDLEIRMGLVDPVNTLRKNTTGGNPVGPRNRHPQRWVGQIRVGTRPSNVVYGINIYQQNGLDQFGPASFLFVGSSINGFDVNDNLTNEPGIDHVTIATRYARAVANAIFNANN